LQPSAVEKKDRRIGFLIGVIVVIFILRAFFRKGKTDTEIDKDDREV